jgi:CubicO group peptidase (beta-lactamase class C family)
MSHRVTYKHCRIAALALLCSLLMATAASAQPDHCGFQKIDAFVRKVQKDWNVPGVAVGIVKDGEIVFAEGYGVAELDTEQLIDADTLFVTASITKTFITTSLAILVDEGKLNWDDRATQYLPELRLQDRLATQELTVRDLVSHRSGLGTFGGDLLWYESSCPPSEILRRVKFLKPEHGFRSQFGYQNLMFIAAGQVIERITGQTCSDFVQSRLLIPLGMDRTTTSTSEFSTNVASPHNESGGTLRVLSHCNIDHTWGAAGLNSSVNDLCRWMQFHLEQGQWDGHQMITKRQLWELTQPHMHIHMYPAQTRLFPARNFSAYGLGWFLHDHYGHKVISHGGGLDGMTSDVAMVPSENLGVVVLTNSESPLAVITREYVLDELLAVESSRDLNQQLLDRRSQQDLAQHGQDCQRESERVPGTSPTIALERLAGRFRCPLYGDVLINKGEDGNLVMKFEPAPNLDAALEHWHYNTFEIKWLPSVKYNFPRGFLTFTIDAAGQADRLVIDQPNNDLWFHELDLRRVE